MKNNQRIKKLVILSVLAAIAVVVNVMESMIPIIPGTAFKIGFANIITLIAIFTYGPVEGAIVGIVRIFLGGLLSPTGFGPTFLLSFTGGLFSLVTIIIFKLINKFSIVAVSTVSSLMHVVGQLLAASFLLSDVVIYYAPIMLSLSIPAGILTGFLALRFLKISEPLFKEKEKPN
ncbi:MAG: Gx transporter family protein [Acholeplasmataceae bacterium]|jgi:heptaprenyl diphosphate synthase|nr:Gx transporter family protein [Acholeplasmataceae bacterium]